MKVKSENKNMSNDYRSFLESKFAGSNRLSFLAYSNQDNNSKRYNAKK